MSPEEILTRLTIGIGASLVVITAIVSVMGTVVYSTSSFRRRKISVDQRRKLRNLSVLIAVASLFVLAIIFKFLSVLYP